MVEEIVELIRRTSTVLPDDVVGALRAAREHEEPGGRAHTILGSLLENASLAAAESVPICQDTGTAVFYVERPASVPEGTVRRDIVGAVRTAVARNHLRPNAVDPVDGANSGDGTGAGIPQIFFRESNGDRLGIRLLLKGGGCENVGTQYSLPDTRLEAGRDADGVRTCILDAVVSAQGMGCAPGILGVGIGGDRGSSHLLAKKQLLRRLDDEHDDGVLAELEADSVVRLNELGIGPMGLGGNTTVLGVKIGAAARHPASFFVTVAYMCWACRRGGMTLDAEGVTYD